MPINESRLHKGQKARTTQLCYKYSQNTATVYFLLKIIRQNLFNAAFSAAGEIHLYSPIFQQHPVSKARTLCYATGKISGKNIVQL